MGTDRTWERPIMLESHLQPQNTQHLQQQQQLQQQQIQQQQQQQHQQQQQQSQQQQNPQLRQMMTNQYPTNHSQRQLSVGYNLQHEFETLTADLDLDLKNYPRQGSDSLPVSSSSNPPSSVGTTSNGNSLLAPSASKYGFSDLLGTGGSGTPLTSSGTPLANSLLRDNALSPIQTSVPTNNLSSLLAGNNSASFLPPLASIPDRPQSVNDFSNYFNRQSQQSQASEQQHSLLQSQSQSQQSNFYSDLLAFTNWIENLNPQDNLTMIEYLCGNLPLDILLTFKSKLDANLNHQATNKPYLSPYHEIYNDMDNLSLGSSDPQHSSQSQPQLHQPKPKLKNNFGNSYLFSEQKNPRPKSAEPSIHNKAHGQNQQPQQNHPPHHLERTRSPTSHLYEKTSFLQQAAANPNSPLHHPLQGNYPPSQQQQQPTKQHSQPAAPQTSSTDDSMDMSAHTALKLGALATINSRVALDSNRKYGYGPYANGNGVVFQGGRPGHFEDVINRNGTSSVPLPRNINAKSPPSKGGSGLGKKSLEQEQTGLNRENLSGINSPTNSSSSNSSMPAEVCNLELLNNIPAWLKLLRLHKYTDFLKDIPWRQLVEMSNEELEATGVVALGARRKLLKAFDVVKKERL